MRPCIYPTDGNQIRNCRGYTKCMNPINQVIAAIAVLRKSGMSQTKIAAAVGVHQTTICRISYGNHRPMLEVSVALVHLAKQIQDEGEQPCVKN